MVVLGRIAYQNLKNAPKRTVIESVKDVRHPISVEVQPKMLEKPKEIYVQRLTVQELEHGKLKWSETSLPDAEHKTVSLDNGKSIEEAGKVADVPEDKPRDLRNMKESKVPETRIGRLYEFTTLGVSLGTGLLSDTLKYATGFSDSRKGVLSEPNVERLVAKLSKMRGAALKIGQMLSIQDNETLAPELHRILVRVQNSANFMPEWQRLKVLERELGEDWESKFAYFDPVPIAAASIGQVHKAKLLNRQDVCVKIQYPGVAKSIDSDLDNLMMLLNFGNFLPKGLYLDNTIRVARKELQLECDYIREADCMDKFAGLIKEHGLQSLHVPKVFHNLTTKEVLTTEYVHGYTIDKASALPQHTRDRLGQLLLELCLAEVFKFRFMQTDPNFGNFLFDSEKDTIQLLDFGAAREYSKVFVDDYLLLLKAGADQNRQKAIDYSVKLGFLSSYESEAMLNAHINSLFLLARPFRSGLYDFGKSNELTSQVRSDIPIMLNERLKPPPDETYSLHRKLSGCFLLCGKLKARVDCASAFQRTFDSYKFD